MTRLISFQCSFHFTFDLYSCFITTVPARFPRTSETGLFMMGISRHASKSKIFYIQVYIFFSFFILAYKVPNTTKAEFANTVDPDETAHYGSTVFAL